MYVTELVRDWLLVENPRVAELDERAYLIGLQPGVTSLREAAFSVWLQFSDETATLVSAFDPAPYSLRLSSLADTVVTVTPGPTQRVVAQGDGGGPLLRAELLVSTCPAQKQAANERGGGGGGGGEGLRG
ncbi:hypothetical protein ANANG_G00112380 [Anguilla anguilla]|uniref:Transmembrane protein TMEM132 sixth domain-containing protein n=1 Tax=Anguilla anguilla TaxID=7936 RepID=A0A9D3MIJ4_ANGAN|nr:hypothetical protein ANANG_G00112380 [Anguilla anguilla]